MVCIVCVSGCRLPKDVIPRHYQLEVMTYLRQKDNFTFDGKVWIDVSMKYVNIKR